MGLPVTHGWHKLKRKNLAKKSGQRFEELITWIQTCLHKSAIIKPNEKIKDVDTGKPRQVDITIRLSDGPTEFFGIVEVRNRKHPIGVRYVEEISGKLRSVAADAAFLVSKSGFTKTAITKAKQLSIRILSYEEAKTENWSNWLDCRTLGVVQPKYDNVSIIFYEKGTNKDIIPSSRSIEILNKNGPNGKFILDEHGNPIYSLIDLINLILNSFGQKLRESLPKDGTRINRSLSFQGEFDPTLWIETDQGVKKELGNVKIKIDLFNERIDFPLKLARYRVPGSNQSIAELATSDVEILGKKYRIELIVPGAGNYMPAGTTISVRKTKLE